MAFIDHLIKNGWLETPRIIDAFKVIDRANFMPGHMKMLAGLNQALPIGHGQTISQPLVVAFMLEQLSPQKGDKVLDVGSGSGWTTALLSHIVGPEGKVIGIEIVPELKEFGEKNTAKYNFVEKGIAEFVCTDGSQGYKKEAPFERILASASGKEMPEAWGEQLRVGGRIVAPLKSSIWVYEKKSETEFEKTEHPGFAFVPLIEEKK